ncbi:hypothetical protein KUTeg_014475 [Tegillarca granosa]|uniref:Uncharacterized protein n=1 Tax=Tegillarca granosa TaxID=220873 RepID=A0ABQ9ETP4_TEGGR|nr:hypothetical protein KUTeg_015668 [Tegillarca granosa]KAJ8307974.1 hypothetical protein KUTeg_014475 [Tegillarca granosa]
MLLITNLKSKWKYITMANNQDPRYGVYSYDQPAAQHNGMNTSPPVYAYDQPSDSRIFSSQTTPGQNYCNNAIARGDMEEARSSSVNARNYSITSIVVGVIIIVVFVILKILVFSTAKN